GQEGDASEVRRVTAETRAALNAMGAGMRLRIPHNGGPAEVVEGTPRLKRPTFAVAPKIVADLSAGFHIAKPPEQRTDGKLRLPPTVAGARFLAGSILRPVRQPAPVLPADSVPGGGRDKPGFPEHGRHNADEPEFLFPRCEAVPVRLAADVRVPAHD